MFFYNCLGQEEISASGTSYLNRFLALLVKLLSKELKKPYSGMRRQCAKRL